MQFNSDYQNFLRELDNIKTKTIYARITALTFNESPIETIEGRVTQGSINLDGESSLRRTCALSLVATNLNYNDYYWGLNTKFKLEIGVQNNINPLYPEIIWFKQGIYLISSFSTSHSTNSYTISIQGKDKMCQLNGEVSGSLTSTVDFGTMETIDIQGNVIITKIPIKDIIRNMVHQFAGEPIHNIIINDLEDYGLELLEYRYDKPLYLYRPVDNLCYRNILIDGNKICYVNGVKTTLGKVEDYHFETLVETTVGTTNPTPIQFAPGTNADKYYVAKIKDGHTAGYRPTELTYAGDLIGNVGDSITSILDKIKNMLGQFEYFYNIDGKFVFQKKQSLINTLWTPQENKQADATYEASLAAQSVHQYIFTESNLITAFNNNPNLLNLRNDYSIHGMRTTIQGAEVPISMRYAIDKKPSYYKNFDKQIYTTDKEAAVNNPDTFIYVDWREIIYQMALDFYKHNQEDNFSITLAQNNRQFYPNGSTGYEQYYIDMEKNWRSLYNPNPPQGSSDYYLSGERKGWNKKVYERPEMLDFWFDFLDTEGELQQFNVKNIGPRTKSINDNNIKSIYFRETPEVLFVKTMGDVAQELSNYPYIQYPDDSMFTISSQGQSAKNKLDELLYQHGYCSESATITAIPIYYLEPNTRIYIHDEKTNLDGDYIISKISLPLSYNGMMQLTVTKAAETLI